MADWQPFSIPAIDVLLPMPTDSFGYMELEAARFRADSPTPRLSLRVFMDHRAYKTGGAIYLNLALLHLIPRLHEVGCRNPRNLSFPQELMDTEVPHLIEHVTLALQASCQVISSYPPGKPLGQTHWKWWKQPPGTFHVWVTYGNRSYVAAALVWAVHIVYLLASGTKNAKHWKSELTEELAALEHIYAVGKTTGPRVEAAQALRRCLRLIDENPWFIGDGWRCIARELQRALRAYGDK